jgi:hypothetical protein
MLMLFPLQYGLQSAFSEIERLEHEVTSSGNPISLTMKTRYKVKGIGMEQTISSVVNIFHDGGKITKVQDKWNGKLPDGAIANVSYLQLLNPFWWAYHTWAWMFYLWSFVWWTRAWLVRRALFYPAPQSKSLLHTTFTDYFWLQAFRNLNSITVPKIISVPKNKEEDAARGN